MFVRKSARQLLPTLLAAALLLASCGGGATPAPTVDINAIQTAAVNTAMAQVFSQLTQTALAAPSPTSLPSNTAIPLPTAGNESPTAPGVVGANPTLSFNITPAAGFTQLASPAPAAATAPLGDACDNNVFIQDTTVPDGTTMKPGEDFTKVWRVKNTGNCTWDDGYSLVLAFGDNLDGQTYKIKDKVDFVAPGAAADLPIKMTAHVKEGEYSGCWRMKNDRGSFFGTYLCVLIKVVK